MTREELLASLEKSLGEKIQNKTEFRSETTYTISPSDLHEIAKFCRDELSFDYLIDITSIDNFGEEPRFEIVYELYSMPSPVYVRLKLHVSEEMGAVDTVSDIWPTANWHEREIYDMMGIKFNGHPDLRRILMWDEFVDHPMRKDYREPDDYEYEPTPHDDVLDRAKQHYAPRPQLDGAEQITATDSHG
jgi:NADH-quinone oxidoreductase subunit C